MLFISFLLICTIIGLVLFFYFTFSIDNVFNRNIYIYISSIMIILYLSYILYLVLQYEEFINLKRKIIDCLPSIIYIFCISLTIILNIELINYSLFEEYNWYILCIIVMLIVSHITTLLVLSKSLDNKKNFIDGFINFVLNFSTNPLLSIFTFISIISLSFFIRSNVFELLGVDYSIAQAPLCLLIIFGLWLPLTYLIGIIKQYIEKKYYGLNIYDINFSLYYVKQIITYNNTKFFLLSILLGLGLKHLCLLYFVDMVDFTCKKLNSMVNFCITTYNSLPKPILHVIYITLGTILTGILFIKNHILHSYFFNRNIHPIVPLRSTWNQAIVLGGIALTLEDEQGQPINLTQNNPLNYNDKLTIPLSKIYNKHNFKFNENTKIWEIKAENVWKNGALVKPGKLANNIWFNLTKINNTAHGITSTAYIQIDANTCYPLSLAKSLSTSILNERLYYKISPNSYNNILIKDHYARYDIVRNLHKQVVDNPTKEFYVKNLYVNMIFGEFTNSEGFAPTTENQIASLGLSKKEIDICIKHKYINSEMTTNLLSELKALSGAGPLDLAIQTGNYCIIDDTVTRCFVTFGKGEYAAHFLYQEDWHSDHGLEAKGGMFDGLLALVLDLDGRVAVAPQSNTFYPQIIWHRLFQGDGSNATTTTATDVSHVTITRYMRSCSEPPIAVYDQVTNKISLVNAVPNSLCPKVMIGRQAVGLNLYINSNGRLEQG